MRPVDELRAAVEGDRSPGPEGQGAQYLGQPGHDRRRSAVRVRRQHLEAAHALDQGSEVASSEPPPELDQVVRRWWDFWERHRCCPGWGITPDPGRCRSSGGHRTDAGPGGGSLRGPKLRAWRGRPTTAGRLHVMSLAEEVGPCRVRNGYRGPRRVLGPLASRSPVRNRDFPGSSSRASRWRRRSWLDQGIAGVSRGSPKLRSRACRSSAAIDEPPSWGAPWRARVEGGRAIVAGPYRRTGEIVLHIGPRSGRGSSTRTRASELAVDFMSDRSPPPSEGQAASPSGATSPISSGQPADGRRQADVIGVVRRHRPRSAATSSTRTASGASGAVLLDSDGNSRSISQGSAVASSEPHGPGAELDQVVRRACAAPSGATVPPHPSDRTHAGARRRRGGTRCCSPGGTSEHDASGHDADGAGTRRSGRCHHRFSLNPSAEWTNR